MSKNKYFLVIFINLFCMIIAIDPTVEQIFTTVYTNGYWWTGESHSGCGSNLYQTQLIRQEIPHIIQKFNVRSMLDIPCGDFHWMQNVPLSISYIGADIVKALIIRNQKLYEKTNRIFMHLDIINDHLPPADLILCRDCLVHLSYEQIWKALANIKRSGSKYLLTTGYTGTTHNSDIPTGGWRPLNLMAPPFNLPRPLLIFNEGYENSKCLMLWKIEELSIQ